MIEDMRKETLSHAPDARTYQDMVSFAVSGSCQPVKDRIGREDRPGPEEPAARSPGPADAARKAKG